MADVNMEDIRRRFDDAVTEDIENREEALDDLTFLSGVQWPENVKAAREAAKRPVLTINRLPQFVRQVTGDIRRTNPAIRVEPGDDVASEEMAEFMTGKIRQIEYECDASSIYERAAETAAQCGMGYFRVLLDRDEQDMPTGKIEAIPNPFSVYFDPLAKDPTRKDARYCFVTEEVALDDFKAQYPDAKTSDFEGDGTVEHLRTWITGDYITVVEYFEKERDDSGRPIVRWRKLNGVEVLEGPVDLPTRHLPVFMVPGEEMHIGDRTVRTSVIRYAKDAQRRYNYWTSAHTEIVALQPKAPWLLTPDQIDGYEGEWANAHTDNYAYLLYNPSPDAPPPQRQMPPQSASGMMQEIMLASEELKATTGIYDAALGERSNETSGVAIKQRQLESDISTSIYVDNLAKAIAQCGRVLVEFIQRAYDQTRPERITLEDGSSKIVTLNEPGMNAFGETVYQNDPSLGLYDVRISTGPSYTTMRQEAVDGLLSFVQAYPAAAPLIMDLVARNSDWPGANEIADRLERAVPPGIIQKDPEEMTPQEQQQMQMQQQVAQMQQQMQQMMAQLEMQERQAEVAKKMAEAEGARAGVAKTMADAQAVQIGMQKTAADAGLSAARADGERVDALAAQMELAAQTGAINQAIEMAVQRAVAQTVAALTGPRPF